MIFDFDTVKLDRDDLNSLSDTIGNALDIWKSTDEELIKYWKMLPNNIKANAIEFGISDTPTKEAIYTWLLDNCI